MYYCSLKFEIISRDEALMRILSKVPPPEDCGFTFNACTQPGTSLDTGTIIDLRNGLPEKLDAVYCAALIVTPAQAEGAMALLPRDGYLWVVPCEDSLPEELIKGYFERFAAMLKERFDARRLRRCFDTALDSVPDLVWFKDMKGAHLMVNNGFCGAVAKTKEQIYKKGHYYIWDIPKEEYDQGDYVCLESEDIVIKAGKTCLFDEKVKTKSGMRQFKTYKSPLTDEDGTVFGTCGIAKDVTDLHNINNELHTIMESMPFAVMVEDMSGSVISVNSRFGEYFPDCGEGDLLLWKSEMMKKAVFKDNGTAELTVKRGKGERFLNVSEEPIIDVFGEKIGSITIFMDVTVEHNAKKQTIRTANTDYLTALNNRRSLFAHLEKVKSSPSLAMITVDLDNFKKVNDNFGHQAGDKALRETARIMKESFPDDFIARLGGDEFITVISRPLTEEELCSLTSAFLDRLTEYYERVEKFAVMTASAGIASECLPENGVHDTEGLMHKSDTALYGAKKEGKDRYKVFGGV